MDRFIESLDSEVSMPADATALIREAWAKCHGCDGDEFLTQGLTLLFPRLRDGLDAYNANRYKQAASLLGDLRNDPNLFVAVHAAVYEIKTLVAMDRLLDAGERIDDLLNRRLDGIRSVVDHSYLAPEVAFLHGYCLRADLRYADATRALMEFLDTYPDASQPLVISARQMLEELRTLQPGRIGEVVDLMGYAGRRLAQNDSGDVVRARQQRIIDVLDALIEEAQQRESGSCRNNSSSSSDGRPGGHSTGNPMPDSQLPGGPGAEGPLQDAMRVSPGETWGTMPPAQRERILQALRDNFPDRYRQLVEQYYEQLAKEP